MKTIKTTLYIILALNFISCSDIDPKTTSKTKPLNQTLTRKKQMTKRFDCYGNVTSEKIETINSVSKGFYITPERKTFLYGLSATAMTTNDTSGGIMGEKGFIRVDIAPTLLNIRVIPGLNEIRYRFSYCYNVVNNSKTYLEECAHEPELGDEKSLWIDIKYKVVNLDGVREIHPSQEECAQ